MATSSVVDDITRAAVDLFSTQGYANTSVQQIVEAAGVTKGAMYHYFESKDDLLFSVYERMLSLQTSHLEEIVGRGTPTAQTLHDVCVDVIETSIDFLPEGTVFFRSVHMLSEPRQKEVTRRRRQYHDVFAGLIERGQEEGLYRTDIPARGPGRPLLLRRALPVELVLPRGSRGQGAPRAAADRPLPRRDQGLSAVRAWQVVRYGEPAEVLELADVPEPDARSRAGARPRARGRGELPRRPAGPRRVPGAAAAALLPRHRAVRRGGRARRRRHARGGSATASSGRGSACSRSSPCSTSARSSPRRPRSTTPRPRR